MSDNRSSGASATMNIRHRVEREAEVEPIADPTPSRAKMLVEWIVRMRRCWDDGQPVGVEMLLAEGHPFAEDDSIRLRLLLEEYELRERRGAAPSFDEIRRRFPSLLGPLEAHLRRRPPQGVGSIDAATRTVARSSASVTAVSLPTVIAGHQILEELGRGGMGVVYLARHLELGRTVALKMILSARFAGAEELVRFRIEGETAANLHHPNIVQVFEVGSFENQPYMVLEYIEGGTLSQRLRDSTPSIEESVRLIESLARAVHHAHTHGVVHRDLKPANILLSTLEDAANPLGLPKIADFGLAKHLDRVGSLTETGRVLGTPHYMAPEQAAGLTGRIGPTTDVYSLGAILYELLTGRPPFESSATMDLMVRVISSEPIPVRRLAGRVPRDLETIAAKCLEKEALKRYPSAADLADDLRRFREGEPIHARPVGLVERGWKWACRRPLIAGLVASLFLVTLLGFVGVTAALVHAYRGWSKAEDEQAIADQERVIATRERVVAEQAGQAEAVARRRAETNLIFNRLTRAKSLWQLNDLALSWRELSMIPSEDRGWDWRYLSNLHQGALHTLTQPGMPVIAGIDYSPNGERFAVAMGNPFVAYRKNARPATIILYDSSTRRPVRTLAGLQDVPRSLAYSLDGKYLAAGSVNGYVHVWDVSTGERVRLIRDPALDQVFQVAWSPDGKHLALASHGSQLSIVDFASGELVWKLHTRNGPVTRVVWSPDGRWIASSADRLRLWDARTGKQLREFDHHCTNGLAFSPDSRTLAGAEGNRVRLYATTTWEPLFGFTGQEGNLGGLAFSPDGQMLATAGSDTTVRLWSVHDGRAMASWRGHHGRVTSVAFHPDGHTLISAGAQPGEVKIWGLGGTPEHTRIAEPGFLRVIDGLAFTPDGRSALFVRSGGHMECRDVVTGNLRSSHQLPINSAWLVPGTLAAVSGDTSRIVGVDAVDGRIVRLFDTRMGKTLKPSHTHTLPVWHVAIDQDGTRFASASNPEAKTRGGSRTVELVVGDANRANERLRETWKGRSHAVALSQDGHWVACCREIDAEPGCRVEVWELPLGDAGTPARHHLSLTVASGVLAGVRFSADGRMLAASSREGRLYLWHFPSGSPVHEEYDPKTGLCRVRGLPAQQGLESLAFSPDGRLVAGVSREQVKLWDVHEGLEVLTLRGAPPRSRDGGFTPRVAWSHDGRRLAISNWDRSLAIWDGADVTTPQGREEQSRAARARLPRWYLDNAKAALDRRASSAVAFNLARLKAFEPLERELALRRSNLEAQMGR